MPTKKKRINITLSKEVAFFLERLALRDDIPQAAKAAKLLERGLELEEDDIWDALARERDTDGARFSPHKQAWK